MRLWSIHPKYLDSKGLVALWREALLAQKVLQNQTKGYKNHPQLIRFKNTKYPLKAINYYLYEILKESQKRSYNFNKSKITKELYSTKIQITQGQIEYEFKHLLKKLKQRDQKLYKELKNTKEILPHPIFNIIKGDIETWEIVKNPNIFNPQDPSFIIVGRLGFSFSIQENNQDTNIIVLYNTPKIKNGIILGIKHIQKDSKFYILDKYNDMQELIILDNSIFKFGKISLAQQKIVDFEDFIFWFKAQEYKKIRELLLIENTKEFELIEAQIKEKITDLKEIFEKYL